MGKKKTKTVDGSTTTNNKKHPFKTAMNTATNIVGKGIKTGAKLAFVAAGTTAGIRVLEGAAEAYDEHKVKMIDGLSVQSYQQAQISEPIENVPAVDEQDLQADVQNDVPDMELDGLTAARYKQAQENVPLGNDEQAEEQELFNE